MLNTDPQNLLEESDYAESVRDEKLKGVEESLARRCGPDRGGATGLSPAPENTEHEFLSYLESVLAFDRPVCSLESPLVSKQDEVLALEVGINRWIKASKLRQELRLAVQDFAFAWAVFVTSEKPAPELGEVSYKDGNGKTIRGLAHRPYTKRVPFRTAFRDPLATSPWDMRFAGRVIITDKDSLVKIAKDDPKAGWNPDVIQALPTDTDLQKVGRKPNPGNPSRKEVVYKQMWVADAAIDWELHKIPEKDRPLYHGMIFTLALSIGDGGRKVEGVHIRDPQPFFGPRWGPYTFIGAHVVCDDPFFLSPVQPARSAIKRLNDLNDVSDIAAANYKRILIANSLVEDFAAIVKNGKHDHVFDLPGYEKGMAESLELGGVTNQMLVHRQLAKDKVDELLGMNGVKRGAVTGDASATENALASEAADARMASMERAWRSDGVSQLLMTPCWYFCHDARVKQAISIEEFKRIGGKAEDLQRMGEDGEPEMDEMGEPIIEQPYVYGGTDDYDWFDSLELDIEMYSMRRMSEAVAVEQVTFLLNYTTTIVPLVPQMPWLQWDLLNRTLAKLTGIQELRSLVRLDIAGTMAGVAELIKMHERQMMDDEKAAGGSGGSKPQQIQPAKGPQAMQAGPAPLSASKPQGGAANAPKAKPAALPGRSSGGKTGNAAAQVAGAA